MIRRSDALTFATTHHGELKTNVCQRGTLLHVRVERSQALKAVMEEESYTERKEIAKVIRDIQFGGIRHSKESVEGGNGMMEATTESVG